MVEKIFDLMNRKFSFLFFLEFELERDLLISETFPKLQQYFLTQGVYISLIDCHLNWEIDPSKNPHHVLRLIKDLQDAQRTSTGIFLLVS